MEYEVVTWKIWGNEPIAWIMDIAIDPEYHGLGYGYKLLEHVVYETKTKYNMNKIGLSVTISNVNAKSLYDRFGFKDYEFYVEMIDPMAIKTTNKWVIILLVYKVGRIVTLFDSRLKFFHGFNNLINDVLW